MQKAAFFRQLAALLEAGMTPATSLAMAAPKMLPRPVAQSAIAACHAGKSLATALHQPRSPFSRLELSLLRLGEESGTLVTVCQQLATQAEVQRQRSRLYGSILLSVAATGLVLLLVLLALLLGQDRVLGQPLVWGLGLLLAIALVAQGLLPVRGELGPGVAKLLRQVPGLRGMIQAQGLTQFSALALPLSCGLAVDRSLELVRPHITDPLLAEAVQRAIPQVRRGRSLSQALAGQIPPPALQMLRTGEETGTLDTLLRHLGDYAEEDLKHQLQRLEAMLRPLSLLAMGLLVLMIGLQVFANLKQ